MSLNLADVVLAAIHAHGEQAYPEEGAGLLFGHDEEDGRRVVEIYPLDNSRENEARHNRYLITPQHMLRGEQEAARRGLDVVGVFHSHPDHPNRPSEFDRDWALPWYSYIITSVQAGKAIQSRSWRLLEDRSLFIEEDIQVVDQVVKSKKAE